LSFCGEASHITDDRFFLTAIKTQGLLLQNVPIGKLAFGYATLQRPTVSELIPSAAGSPSALAVFD
jgi:hypothetical protein